MPLGVRRSHRPAAISPCGTAPVASTTQRALTSCMPSADFSRAPTTRSPATSGASKRTGVTSLAPARWAARTSTWSNTLRGSTESVPGTSTCWPRGPTQRTWATGAASAATSSCTPRRRKAAWASGIRPSPQILSRGKSCWSISSTSCPARASHCAHALPAGPAPMTSTSQWMGRSIIDADSRQAREGAGSAVSPPCRRPDDGCGSFARPLIRPQARRQTC